MTIALVVQARLGSTRLPRKVLRDVGPRSLLSCMLERLAWVRTDVQVVVATTTRPEDDAICDVAASAGARVFRGHETDLLDRHIRAARSVGADVVVKVPSDCPLIDPALVDEALHVFLGARGALDYVSNLHPRTYADGNDVEVMSRAALEEAHAAATRAIDFEHTTPFLVDHPRRFIARNVVARGGAEASRFRYVVDYVEDLEVVRAVDAALRVEGAPYGHRAIAALLESRPDIVAMNAMHVGDCWQRRLSSGATAPSKGVEHARPHDVEIRRVRG